MALVFGLIVLTVSYPLQGWFSQSAELNQLEADTEVLAAEVSDLEDELDRWSDPAYIRTQARERLNVVSPGEVGALVVGELPTDSQAAPLGVVVPGSTEDTPWWSQVWAGVEEAGREPGSAPAVPDEVVGVPTP